ncbi:MAG: protein kinase domain-containing protein [Nocardioidaceae bacterium]
MTSLASVGAGRYALRERIATGGMGEVWRATDTVLGREVAVKILRAEYADDATFRARFQAEARNTAALHHPAVAQVFDFGEIPDTDGQRASAFLVMELVPGEPLSAVLAREGALDPARAADIVAQAAAGIDVAHRRGIVHRDVKPANLLVTPDGTVKVTDFGIARAGDAVPLTGTGQVIGTAQYLSPEQAKGNPAGPASDVYSLAVVLYECLTGTRPFTADQAVAVAMQHLRDDPPPLPAWVPAGLAALCMSALSKEPGDRPATAGDLAAHLRDPGLATGTGPAAPVTAPMAATAAAPSSPEHTAVLSGTYPAHQRPRRRVGLLVPIAAAVAVLLLVGAIGYALTGSDEPQADGDAPSGSGGAAAEPQGVRVDPSDYVGQPYPEARNALEADGLRVARTNQRGADGTPGTVAYVQPHGRVPEDSTVTLGVWQSPPPAPAPEPAPKPDKGDDSRGKGDDEGKPPTEHKKDKHGKGHEPPGLLGGLDDDENDGED